MNQNGELLKFASDEIKNNKNVVLLNIYQKQQMHINIFLIF
ncbi:DUF4116 domain-containing protein [Mycoplasmopsis cynos]